mmetsp:Transcript_12933/g.17019  ORF Transcript_12933/g.17019 Transcript_12933/m.17019 type:complete len:606 (-) Transcript_12933:299-2116(-)|eukprot:CAMPEP_0117748822 /NCGR_PEP_ID=MMETSP0947-20121206/9378_1 /TAXON_ID=44440 /ORGANISM="Chattonella subsalsa, Strain CCMP2191" /LENGTH=605 /DNA_ID=CAMNT_0005566625 /DNA_START=78 /DNA_END=1898 /DNA_ORIENTATION=+
MKIIKFIRTDKYAGYVLALMVLVYFSNQFDRFIFSSSKIPFIDYKSYEYGLLVGPIFTVMYTLAGIFMGLVGEVQRVKVLYSSVLIWSLFIACISITSRFWQVGILMAGLGIGEAGCTPFASALLSDIFPEELQGTAMGIYNLSIYFAYGMALALGSLSQELLGWGGIYLIAGGYGIAIGLLVAFTVKDPMDAQTRTSLFTAAASSRTYSAVMGRHMSEEGRARLMRRERTLSIQFNSPTQTERKARAPSATTPFRDAFKEAGDSLRRVWRWWSQTPSLMILCIAAGFRKGAGVIWADYTAIFFSDMFTLSSEQTYCEYSFNPAYGQPASSTSVVCPEEYPFCLASNQGCATLSETPWHNQGMDRDDFECFIAWVPLVMGSIGVLTGGWLSDYYVKTHGPKARVYVMVALTALAAPFAAGVLVLGYPWCFVALMGCLLLGEGWMGACLALVLDCSPPSIKASSVAIFQFITSNIGGNMALLCPFFRGVFKEDHTYTFDTYPAYGTTEQGIVQTEIVQESSSSIQNSLLILFPGMYIASSILFLAVLGYLYQDFESSTKYVPPSGSANKKHSFAGNVDEYILGDADDDSLPFLDPNDEEKIEVPPE